MSIEPKTTRQKVTRIGVLTVFALLLLDLTKVITVTYQDVLLLALALLPWAGLFIKRLFFGDNSVEFEEGRSESKPAITIPNPSPEPFMDLPHGAKRVLATLWFFQNGVPRGGFWTFAVFPAVPNDSNYSDYITGIVVTGSRRLTTVDPKNGQTMLTSEGMRYCEENRAPVEAFRPLLVNPP
jgi:hypothetical protein